MTATTLRQFNLTRIRRLLAAMLELLVAIVMIAAGWQLLRRAMDPSAANPLTGQTSTTISVGTVQKLSGEARWKNKGAFSWFDLGADAVGASSGDRLFTGQDGTASVRFSTGDLLRVEPESLVVIAQADSQSNLPTINLEKGSVSLQATSSQPMIVRWKDKEYTLKRTSGTQEPLRIDTKEGTLRLQSSAQFSVETQGASLGNVGPQQAISVDADARAQVVAPISTKQDDLPKNDPAPALAPVPEGPSVGYAVPVEPGETTAPVLFSWSTPSDATRQRVEYYEIEVQAIHAPDRVPIRTRTPTTAAEVRLPPGSYEWRLRTKISDGALSAWGGQRSVHVAGTTAEQARLKTTESTPLVTTAEELRRPPAKSEPVAISVTEAKVPQPQATSAAVTPKPRRIAQEQTAEPPAATLPLPEQAAIADLFDSEPIEKLVLDQVTIRSPKLAALESSAAAANTEYTENSKLDEVSVGLSWKAVPEATAYQVEVRHAFTGEHFSILRSFTTSTQVRFSSLQNFNYEYRVRALKGEQSLAQSEYTPIRLNLTPPVPKSPENGESFTRDSEVLFSWRRTSLTQMYTIQISLTPDFKAPIVDSTEWSNAKVFQPRSSGTHYWRVQSNAFGRASGWSAIYRFTVK